MKKLIFKINCIFVVITVICMPIFASSQMYDIPVDNDVRVYSYKIEKKNGEVKKGIIKEGDYKYLYDNNGNILRNYFYADKKEKYYYSDENGQLVNDTYVLIDYKTASNVRQRNFIDKVYYFNHNGVGREVEGNLSNKILNADDVKKTYAFDDISKAKVGDFVKFGNYNNDEYANFEIEWEILDKTDDKYLLISKYIVWNLKIEKNENDDDFFSWKNSNVRILLNNKFINTAFKDNKYYNKILETKILDNNEFIDDKIFLLSQDEIIKYYGENRFDANGVLSNSNAYTMAYHFVSDIYIEEENPLYLSLSPYMTRNVDSKNNTITIVKSSGELEISEIESSYGIRPAMWIKER